MLLRALCFPGQMLLALVLLLNGKIFPMGPTISWAQETFPGPVLLLTSSLSGSAFLLPLCSQSTHVPTRKHCGSSFTAKMAPVGTK